MREVPAVCRGSIYLASAITSYRGVADGSRPFFIQWSEVYVKMDEAQRPFLKNRQILSNFFNLISLSLYRILLSSK